MSNDGLDELKWYLNIYKLSLKYVLIILIWFAYKGIMICIPFCSSFVFFNKVCFNLYCPLKYLQMWSLLKWLLLNSISDFIRNIVISKLIHLILIAESVQQDKQLRKYATVEFRVLCLETKLKIMMVWISCWYVENWYKSIQCSIG